MSTEHVEKVIDALLLHPRVHQHIESPINDHEIRIGGGIHNPFVFLFHLRYQLCSDPTKRKDEKSRLVSLFESEVKNKKKLISANKLLLKK